MNIALIVIGLLLLLIGSLGVTGAVVMMIVKVVQKKSVKKSLKWTGITVAATVIGLAVMITGIIKDNNSSASEESYVPESSSVGYKTEVEKTDVEIEEEEKQDVYEEKEKMITDFVDKNFQFDTTVTEFELNDHLGTDVDDDYIALVHLDMPKAFSVKRGYEWIEKYTNYLAAEIGQSDDDISELAIFWTMAGSEKNVAKYTLTRNGDNFNFDSQWQDPNVTD